VTQKNLLKKYKVVEEFEHMLCSYTNAPYAVSVDCCTNALFLCFLRSREKEIILPKNTYVGVSMVAKHANKKVSYDDIDWFGLYKIEPTNIYDSARRFTSNMYMTGTNMCLSFHYKKHLKIGRGGAILTDNTDDYEWFKRARNCGKDISKPLSDQFFTILGTNALLHPDLALKGKRLLSKLPLHNPDLPYEYYGDLSKQLKVDLK
jgi:dTDP-4-amino-4,6-dideoxygalactose transaminase